MSVVIVRFMSWPDEMPLEVDLDSTKSLRHPRTQPSRQTKSELYCCLRRRNHPWEGVLPKSLESLKAGRGVPTEPPEVGSVFIRTIYNVA
jgi:hypothetical protein